MKAHYEYLNRWAARIILVSDCFSFLRKISIRSLLARAIIQRALAGFDFVTDKEHYGIDVTFITVKSL